MQTEGKALIMDEKAMGRAINRISYEIIERDKGAQDLCIIGIFSRGVELAARIAEKIRNGEKVLNSELRKELASIGQKQSQNQGG